MNIFNIRVIEVVSRCKIAMFLDFEMLPKCCILVDIVRHYQGRGYKDEATHVGTQYLNILSPCLHYKRRSWTLLLLSAVLPLHMVNVCF
jgi:hypothetical protein